jgi:hypothetical protein
MKTCRLHYLWAALALALFTLSAGNARACACCSDPGEYSVRTDKISAFQWGELEGLEFGAKAQLFTTDAGDDAMKGISTVAAEYAVTAEIDQKQWRLKFRTADGKTGSLTLTVPAKLTDFDVDIHDGQKSAGGGPLLYKEWRMEGTGSGDGIFHQAKAHYSLVLQGRGNRCDSKDDFTHWRLAVSGKNIDYSLHGELVSERGASADAEPEKKSAPEKPTDTEKKDAK